MTFDATFGISYTFKKDLNVGLSLPQLLGTKADLGIDGSKYNLVRHSNIYASYRLFNGTCSTITRVLDI